MISERLTEMAIVTIIYCIHVICGKIQFRASNIFVSSFHKHKPEYVRIP